MPIPPPPTHTGCDRPGRRGCLHLHLPAHAQHHQRQPGCALGRGAPPTRRGHRLPRTPAPQCGPPANTPCRAVPCRAVPCRAVPCRAVPLQALALWRMNVTPTHSPTQPHRHIMQSFGNGTPHTILPPPRPHPDEAAGGRGQRQGCGLPHGGSKGEGGVGGPAAATATYRPWRGRGAPTAPPPPTTKRPAATAAKSRPPPPPHTHTHTRRALAPPRACSCCQLRSPPPPPPPGGP